VANGASTTGSFSIAGKKKRRKKKYRPLIIGVSHADDTQENRKSGVSELTDSAMTPQTGTDTDAPDTVCLIRREKEKERSTGPAENPMGRGSTGNW
jgi:hypothetical protein